MKEPILEQEITFVEHPVIADVAIWKRTRYFISFLVFLSVTVTFIMRTALTIAVVAMTSNDTRIYSDAPVFNWPIRIQSIMLSAFFIGYATASIPGGMVVQRFGPRKILLYSIIICSISFFTIPTASRLGGWQLVAAIRVFEGFAQSPAIPSVNAVFAKWSPPSERGRLGAIGFAGVQAGNIIILVSGGIIASSSLGWPAIFYIFGSCGLAWCLLWVVLASDCPSSHRFITQKEVEYIQYTLKDEVRTPPSFNLPWKAVFTSAPSWATTISFCVQHWGFYMLINELPTFMAKALKFDIRSNGVYSALPYVVMLILIFVFIFISEYIIKHNILSVTWNRKLFTSIGFLGPMVFLASLTLVHQRSVAVVLLMIITGLNAAVYVGFIINHVDLAPNYAGMLMGICNAFANVISIVVTVFVGNCVPNDGRHVRNWDIVFWTTSGIYFFGGIVYLIFGSGEIQPWNNPLPSVPAAPIPSSSQSQRHSNANTVKSSST